MKWTSRADREKIRRDLTKEEKEIWDNGLACGMIGGMVITGIYVIVVQHLFWV